MADRLTNLPGYPAMQPNGFQMPNQQQQFMPRHPQQQQGAPGPSQGTAGMPDVQRLMQWQQMQDQYRVTQMNAESMNPQVNSQMDFMRNQATAIHQSMNQGQVQQQGMQQNQPQFQNMTAMNGMNQGQQSQSPALQNQRPVMPQQMGFNGGNQVFPQNAAQLVARNANSGMNPAMLPSGLSRQLGLLGNARNQQPQNAPGPMRLPPHMQSGNAQTGMQPGQPQFQQQASNLFPQGTAQNGVRTSPAMQQATPNQNAGGTALQQVTQMSQNFLVGPNNRRLTPEETARKLLSLKEEIIEKETRLRAMSGNNQSGENNISLREQQQDLQMNKVLFGRLAHYLQTAYQNGVVSQQAWQKLGVGSVGFRPDGQGPSGQNQPSPSTMNGVLPNQPMNIPQKPSQLAPSQNPTNWQQAGPSGFGTQQNFNNSHQQAVTVQSQGPMANGAPNINQFQHSPNIQRRSTPLPQNIQNIPNHAQMMQSIMTSRQNQGHPSPQPGLNQQMTTQMPPNVPQVPTQQSLAPPPPTHVQMNRATSPMPQYPPGLHIPPLDLQKFNSGLSSFLQKKGSSLDQRALLVDNRQIDLHALHTETIKLGGPSRVNSQDVWEVIAAKLGWNNFPGNGNEPGRSGPHIASHISNIYKEYLAEFEASYMRIYLNNRHGMLNQQHQMFRLAQYAHLSVDELRAQNVPDTMIQQIEANRPALQRIMATHDLRQAAAAAANGGQPGNMPPGVPVPGQQQTQQLQFSQVSQSSVTAPPHVESVVPPQPGPSNLAPVPGMQSGQPRPHPIINGVHSMGQLKPRPTRPTQEQMHLSQQFAHRLKEEYTQNRNAHLMSQKQVADQDVPEFSRILEEVSKVALTMEKALPVFHSIFQNEDYTRRLSNIIMTVAEQRQLLQQRSGKFIFDMNMANMLSSFVRQSHDAFQRAIQLYNRMPNTQISHHLQPNGPQGISMQVPSQSQQPPSMTTDFDQPIPAQQQSLQPPMRQHTAVQPINQQQPASLRHPPAGPMASPIPQPVGQHGKSKSAQLAAVSMVGADSSPSPAASASTPAAAAATPSHVASSPQTPKSPKTRAPKKEKAPPKGRRASKATKPPAAQLEATPAPQQNLKRPRDEEEPAQPASTPSAAPPTPAADASPVKAESPAPVPIPAPVAIERPPSAKRMKSEWSSLSKEEAVKEPEPEQDIKDITSKEEAAKFYDDMSELLKSSDPTGAIPAEVSDVLQQILSAMGTSMEYLDATNPAPPIAGPSEPPAPKSPPAADWVDFFDFSSFVGAEDDGGSKADTPDLVHTSSANPSPESASDADGHTNAANTHSDTAKIIDPAADDSNESSSDPLRLGLWGEIDGGESAYFNSTEWKWDGIMPSSDNSWAFLQS